MVHVALEGMVPAAGSGGRQPTGTIDTVMPLLPLASSLRELHLANWACARMSRQIARDSYSRIWT
jgi:hypothetical protein